MRARISKEQREEIISLAREGRNPGEIFALVGDGELGKFTRTVKRILKKEGLFTSRGYKRKGGDNNA